MANSIEEPAFEPLFKLGKVEIREYAPSIQAVTPLRDSRGSNTGFRKLAGYIFGGNSGDQSIAMTAPVEETLGSSAPTMAFTMPSEYSMEKLPRPDDSSVTLVAVPSRVMAVVGFSGWATEKKVRKYLEVLESSLMAQDVETVGTPSLNQYNPPWTPPFLRRNEVMIEVRLNTAGLGETALAF